MFTYIAYSYTHTHYYIHVYTIVYIGNAVTKRTFSGQLSQIDPFFRAMVDRYVREVFEGVREGEGEAPVTTSGGQGGGVVGGKVGGGGGIEAKEINGRALGAAELHTYFQVYTCILYTTYMHVSYFYIIYKTLLSTI